MAPILIVGSVTQKLSWVPNGHGKGVQLYEFEVTKEKQVKLTKLGDPVHTGNDPSFVCPTADGRFIFAGNLSDGTVSVLGFHDETGHDHTKLKLLKGDTEDARGVGTCYLSVDQKQKYLFAANYHAGTVSTFRIRHGERHHFFGLHKEGATGDRVLTFDQFIRYEGKGSGKLPDRQEMSHPHSMVVDPWQAFVYVADLGMDTIAQYAFSAEKGLHADSVKFFDQPLGSGPRHIVFNASGDHMYMSTELSNELVVFRRDRSKGIVKEEQRISTLPPAKSRFKVNNLTDLVMTPNGKFLYVANRGAVLSGAGPKSEDTIAIFELASTGLVTLVGHESARGRTPRNLAIDPSGEFLLASNQDSDTIAAFRIDYEHRGKLVPAGELIPHDTPTGLKFSENLKIDVKA